jgi:hypothetical protein
MGVATLIVQKQHGPQTLGPNAGGFVFLVDGSDEMSADGGDGDSDEGSGCCCSQHGGRIARDVTGNERDRTEKPSQHEFQHHRPPSLTTV